MERLALATDLYELTMMAGYYSKGLMARATFELHVRALPPHRSFFDDYLARFRFSGTVWAVDEGTPVFPPAPLLRVTAPLPEAQLVETVLLAYVGFQTSVASRAVRMVDAAAG